MQPAAAAPVSVSCPLLRIRVIALLSCALLHLVQAGYHHQSLPWQQYYTPVSRWGSKGQRSTRVRAGQGRYRMAQGSAELVCQFPSNYQIMSNIIWERADLGSSIGLDEFYRAAGEEHKYQVVSWANGSRLQLVSPTFRARGLYRCLATGLDPTSQRYPVTLFQDVPFYPEMRSRWEDSFRLTAPPLPPPPARRTSCCGHSYDDYTHRSEYHVKSSVYFD